MTNRERVSNRLRQELHADKRAYPLGLVIALALLLAGLLSPSADRDYITYPAYEETAR